ncbi:hypothetical protein BZB76_5679 [Actinomadura pelletieri DSM 43383]|uniref:Uncharacterized protein n=1 Tax=Actinomadura pelletieri DSM 43383 TaxID=1120940 RepID=A0A495QH01_9ACTN|nr:hypothetical protein BZB76_5679 [Actinomadura pelletieri DSM 43383]
MLLLTQLFVAVLLDAGYDLAQALTAASAVCVMAQIIVRLLGEDGTGSQPRPPQPPSQSPTQPPSGSDF